MMLTAKQPVQHGYRPVHDLPTPPRSSPPLSVQDSLQKTFVALPQNQSPSTKPMSAPHRGLPLPAAMTLAQPPPPPAPGPPHPPAPGPPLHSQGAPAPSPHSQTLGSLPAPPPQHQGSEDAMRSWLAAKTEEEKRKQEEEKTRQETLRLEQRKLEYDMLRTSLDRGIPPPMVPVVFAGMSGGTLSQVALEWAQQYLMPQQAHAAQIMPAQGALSPEARRESQQYGGQQYGVPSTPGSAPGAQASFMPYQGPSSPRHRAHTLIQEKGLLDRLEYLIQHTCSRSNSINNNSNNNRNKILSPRRYIFTIGNPRPLKEALISQERLLNRLRNEKRRVPSKRRLRRAKRDLDLRLSVSTGDLRHYQIRLPVDGEVIRDRGATSHLTGLRDAVELNHLVRTGDFHQALARQGKAD
ncbi:hypothetical protein GL218_00134 [Daldinia childiae]|uniref:uncharacterized protein n=1 Tax=Daldinia childiae TaxID=326645 RepID=UPI0014466DB9|nr:uncharacterized protein GL218_00134 [Daldinia childiae]KAF3070519.1 hypothetical protein GL218_00134 [Daldinia childiae]